MKPTWNGIYPALTTKFTDDYKVDIPSCIKNVEAQINAGIHGCVIAGSLGEASTLTQNEKILRHLFVRVENHQELPTKMMINEEK